MAQEKNILIVDDNHENVELLSCFLSKNKDYNLFKASNGMIALDVLLRNSISLILLDLSMPVMNGFELLNIIKNSERTEKIPVIIISSHSVNEISDYDISKRIDAYIQKPVNWQELLRIVNIILN